MSVGSVNEISTSAEHATTAEHPFGTSQNDEETKIIPTGIKNNVHTHANTRDSDTIQKKSYWSEHQSFILTCAFILFTIVAMTIGITTVCVTAPKNTNNTCQLTFRRTAERLITYDSRPRHVAIGDFNQDHHLDLVIANSGVDTIGIRLGYTNGTFGNEITYATGVGSRPYWVIVGDFNNDTLPDIVVANYGTNSIGLFLGYGNGMFRNQSTFSLGPSRPLSIAVGDFNNDNQPDIAIASDGTFYVTILLGFGNGSFQIKTNYYMGHDSMPCSLAIADFNNDDRLDVVTVNYGTSELAILLATENATYSIDKYSTGTGSHPCSVTTGDFNNDSLIDIAVVNSGTNNIGIFLANGYGTFMSINTYSTRSNSYLQFIVTGDLNNDNQLDLIVANPGEDNIIVFEGRENGTFSIAARESTGYNSDPYAIVPGDFDHDNRTDIAVVNNGMNDILILTSYAFHTTANISIYSTGTDSFPNSVVVGYFNNDSQLDIAVANTYGYNIGIFIGYGDGTFQDQEISPTIDFSYTPYSIVVGDFNNDTYLDIAAAMLSTNDVHIYFGQGNGYFEYEEMYSVGDYSYPNAIATADFNNDTKLDIVTANIYGDNVAVLLGYGNGVFSNASYYSTEEFSSPVSIAVHDFNSDGVLDLVSANYGSATVSVFLGYGDGTFQNASFFSTGIYNPNWLAVEYLNNDRNLDIVLTFPDSSTIGILLGQGNGTFANMHTYLTGIGVAPWAVVVGDFNKDMTIDIAVANAEDPSISIFFGHGDGTFGLPDTIPIDDVSYTYCIATGDFNHDGQVDIVVGDVGSNDIAVLLLEYRTAFGNQTRYPQGSGSHPFCVTTGDFNNDNQMDIVVANSGTDNVQILIDYNNRTFTNKITYSTGINSHPLYVATADFNKDNQVDIAVVNSWNHTIMIILNSNNGTFNTSLLYSTGGKSFPNSIALGDLNKDGWIDVVVANSNTSNVGVFLGYDYPTFIMNQKISSQRGSSPYYVTVGDFNEDSRWDLAVAYRQTNTIDIFLGNGDGTFQKQPSPLNGLSSPVAMTIGDFNNDTHLDIAVANSGSDSISIFLGSGNGTFPTSLSQSTDSSPAVSIAIGDFDHDGKQDLVVANKDTDNVGVFMRYTNESFAEYISCPMPDGSSPVWVVVSDFNKDNISDIAVANSDGNNIGILLGYGNGTFRNVTIYPTGNNSHPCSIAVGDFNKDNCIDIVVANTATNNVGIFFGDGSGTFASQVTYSTSSASVLMSIAVADLNNDTILDIIVSDWGSGNGNIGVLYGIKNGTFLVPKPYWTGFNSQPSSVVICDFNNDSQMDFVVTNSRRDNIIIMLRNQSEPFGIQTTFPTGKGSSPYSVVVGDFNNDDQLDIAVTNFKTNNIGIFLGYGNGSYRNPEMYSTGLGSNPSFIAIGDLNNDKQVDIVFTNSDGSSIGIFLGRGNGSFASGETYSTGRSSEPSSIAIADLNRDNHMDVVVTNRGINTVLVFFGSSNGTLLNPKSYSFDYDSRPISVALGDFNNDSWLDIAVANNGPGYVEVLLQTC